MLPKFRIDLDRTLISAMAAIALTFLALPLVALALRAIQTQAWINTPESGVYDAIWLSFITTLLSVMLTLLFGTPLAHLLARRRFPLKRFVSVLVELPVVLPPAVAGLALLVAYGRRGVFGPVLEQFGVSLPFTVAAVVMAQTFVAAPFYIRAAQLGFQAIPREVEEAAHVDGAGGLALFLFVTFPLAFRALAAGIILSWARALGEFGATILFAGSLPGRTQTMPLLIYRVFERDINAAIWTGLLLVGIALAALLLSQGLARTETRFGE